MDENGGGKYKLLRLGNGSHGEDASLHCASMVKLHLAENFTGSRQERVKVQFPQTRLSFGAYSSKPKKWVTHPSRKNGLRVNAWPFQATKEQGIAGWPVPCPSDDGMICMESDMRRRMAEATKTKDGQLWTIVCAMTQRLGKNKEESTFGNVCRAAFLRSRLQSSIMMSGSHLRLKNVVAGRIPSGHQ